MSNKNVPDGENSQKQQPMIETPAQKELDEFADFAYFHVNKLSSLQSNDQMSIKSSNKQVSKR